MNEKQIKLLQDDFRNFLWFIWKHLGLPEPTPRQYEIAYYLQHGPRRKIIEAFRGIGKSWITAAYVLWRLWKDPQERFLVVSASKERADAFSAFVKRLIREVPLLQHLQPNPEKGQRDSMVAFDVGPSKASQSPSVKSVGIFGQLTGSRATEIIADDIEIPGNSGTQDMRDKLLNRFLEGEAIIVPGGKITLLGTPQTEESIYNKLREKGYQACIWPARYPYPDKVHVYLGDLAESILQEIERNPEEACGTPTDPDRFNDLDLIERESSWGRSGFALQFMLDTSLSDAEKYPLKLSDLIIMPTNPEKAPVSIAWGSNPENQLKELPNVGFTGDRFYRPWRVDEKWTEYEGSVLAIDPSGRGADELSYVVIKQLHGYLFVTTFGGLQGGYDDANLLRLAKVAKEHRVNAVVIEENYGDGMFSKLLEPILARIHPCEMEEVKHSIQKERRIIDTLEPLMNRHRLIIDLDAAKKDIFENQNKPSPVYSLFYQMTRLTKERGALRHDDRLDVLAIGVAYWIEYMNRDEKKAQDDYNDRQLQNELKAFMEHALGPRGIRPKDTRMASLRR